MYVSLSIFFLFFFLPPSFVEILPQFRSLEPTSIHVLGHPYQAMLLV